MKPRASQICAKCIAHGVKKEQELTGFMKEHKADETIIVELYYEAQMVMVILLELTGQILNWEVLSSAWQSLFFGKVAIACWIQVIQILKTNFLFIVLEFEFYILKSRYM